MQDVRLCDEAQRVTGADLGDLGSSASGDAVAGAREEHEWG